MTIDELLDQHTPEVAEICRQLLEHIGAAAEWSQRKVYSGWHGVAFRHSEMGYVVGVFPRRDYVRVVFESGHMLGEAPFLEGTGQTRHVDFVEWDNKRLATLDEVGTTLGGEGG